MGQTLGTYETSFCKRNSAREYRCSLSEPACHARVQRFHTIFPFLQKLRGQRVQPFRPLHRPSDLLEHVPAGMKTGPGAPDSPGERVTLPALPVVASRTGKNRLVRPGHWVAACSNRHHPQRDYVAAPVVAKPAEADAPGSVTCNAIAASSHAHACLTSLLFHSDRHAALSTPPEYP